MSDSENKYKMFKNFMHNELGITKDDIHAWVKEAIKEEVKNVIDQAYGKVNIESVIRRSILEYDLFTGDKLKPYILDKICLIIGKEMLKKYSFGNKEK